MSLESDLETLKRLRNQLRDSAKDAGDIKSHVNTAVDNAIWTGPNSDKFRSAWTSYKPTLDKLKTALSDAERDIRNQHNDLAAAYGAPDRI